ncbi:acyl-CoA dehydrogenase family protein [Roseiconus lacunae]|uniref:acyl-CoA dehydrogenase family protein n=1 Tax=Roseiconus lacunae TaxID=2605694 RepID=UPI0011F28ED4|nr:acyl-CoA dehydrogenase family protein [Roseiconus lacunae]
MDQNFETQLANLELALYERASRWRTVNDWPAESLLSCGQAGVLAGLAGMSGWSALRQVQTLIGLARADLVTTFIITQHLGALKRLIASDRASEQADIIEALSSGRSIGSVGISHLTTSRRHLDRPVVTASPADGGLTLDGCIPWVTGASQVDWIVVGATLPDATEVLALVDANTAGLQPGPGAKMIAMEASCTDAVHLNSVFVPWLSILAGPELNVLSGGSRAVKKSSGAGGLQTSALALGLSFAALRFLEDEATRRDNLLGIVEKFSAEHTQLRQRIESATEADSAVDLAELRTQANQLVQRTTAAAMTTAKGAGLMVDHPVGRYCQQAFFFLVWSCPQPVADAHLCEMAGLMDA